ncbi:MAG: glycosyltransferase 87 family protein [Syntrophobacteraceae bacterium]
MVQKSVDEPAGNGSKKISGLEARLGILTWFAPMLVISVLVALNPQHRTLIPLYRSAAGAWWAGKNLYAGPGGMNYLPQFAVLFSPFYFLPVPFGDILWRWCQAVLLSAGLWSLCKELADSAMGQTGPLDAPCSSLASYRIFFYASLLTMPLCLGALRNGQANGLLAGLGLCSTALLARRRWWWAAALIVLSIGIKPLGIVMLLLAAAFYAPLRLRILTAIGALAVFPFLFAHAGYVSAQFYAFFANIGRCAAVHQNRFADIGGIARAFGIELPRAISVTARLVAGGGFLWLWLAGGKRLREPFRAMWLLTLVSSYLMLFNPMNEANSYAILAPAFGLWAPAAFSVTLRRWFGWLTVAICLSMSLLPALLHPVFGNYFALFWCPLMTALFIGILAWLILAEDEVWSGKTLGAGFCVSQAA